MKFKSLLVIGISLVTLGLSSAAEAKQTQPGSDITNIHRTGFVDRINGKPSEYRLIARIKGPALDSTSIGCKEFQDAYDKGMTQAADSPAGSQAAKDGKDQANKAKSAWNAVCTGYGTIYKLVPQVITGGGGGPLLTR